MLHGGLGSLPPVPGQVLPWRRGHVAVHPPHLRLRRDRHERSPAHPARLLPGRANVGCYVLMAVLVIVSFRFVMHHLVLSCSLRTSPVSTSSRKTPFRTCKCGSLPNVGCYVLMAVLVIVSFRFVKYHLVLSCSPPTSPVSTSSLKTPTRTCTCGSLRVDGCIGYSLISSCHVSSCLAFLEQVRPSHYSWRSDQDVQMWVVMCWQLCWV